MTARYAIWPAMAVLVTGLAAAPAQAEDIAIVGATVHVEPGNAIEGATVLVRAGRVSAVGKDVAVPAGVRRIDGAGKVVTAGLIEASTRLGLIEVGLEESTREGVFGGQNGGAGDVVHAAYRVTDGFNPTSVAIPVARAGGVTSAMVVPFGGLIAGTGAWVSLGRGASAVQSPVAMYAALGEASLDSADGSRGMALMRLRELLADAVEYGRRRREHERNQTRPFAAGRLELEALLPVAQGRVPLVVRVHRSADILAAIQLGRETGARVIIEGGTEAWMVAGELAAAGVGVIMDPTANMPGSFDRVHVRDDAATVLAAAGVDVAISTLGDAARARRIRQFAGIAVANGMRPEQALAAITTVPAKLFGVEDRGRIRAGVVADLVVWSGDPLELSTRAEQVFIGGEEQDIRSRQTELLERYRRLPPAR